MQNILSKYGERIIELIKQSMIDNNRTTTGKTADSLRYEVSNENVLTIFGSPVLEALEFGREPSSSSGGEGFFDELREWATIKIDSSVTDSTVFAIYKKINEQGFEGTDGLLSLPINQGVDELNAELSAELTQAYASKIALEFKKGYKK